MQVLEQETQRKEAENKVQVSATRQARRGATTAKGREQLLVRAERLLADGRVERTRLRGKRSRLAAQERGCQKELAAQEAQLAQVVWALHRAA